jgi:hypothetical protein
MDLLQWIFFVVGVLGLVVSGALLAVGIVALSREGAPRHLRALLLLRFGSGMAVFALIAAAASGRHSRLAIVLVFLLIVAATTFGTYVRWKYPGESSARRAQAAPEVDSGDDQARDV